MITIDEAIQKIEEMAENRKSVGDMLKYDFNSEYPANELYETADEYFQIVKWLREYKAIKSRRGEWKETSDLYPFCSECGYEVTGFGGVRGHESDYCPHCGVKMIRKG